MTPELLLHPSPGYWCECLISGRLLGSFYATCAQQAIRWTRTRLTLIIPTLDDEPRRQARDWCATRQHTVLHELLSGTAQHLTLTQRTTALTWTAGPVLFLPLAHRQGLQLPACSERFAPSNPHRRAH